MLRAYERAIKQTTKKQIINLKKVNSMVVFKNVCTELFGKSRKDRSWKDEKEKSKEEITTKTTRSLIFPSSYFSSLSSSLCFYIPLLSLT